MRFAGLEFSALTPTTKHLRINGPTLEPDDGDYLAQCQFALEPSLVKLLRLAELAGWDRTHVVLAALTLCAEFADLPENRQRLQ